MPHPLNSKVPSMSPLARRRDLWIVLVIGLIALAVNLYLRYATGVEYSESEQVLRNQIEVATHLVSGIAKVILAVMVVRAAGRAWQSEQRFRALSESSPVGIWRSNAAGAINYVNGTAAGQLGLSAAEVVESGWATVIHPDDLERAWANWNEATTAKTSFVFECRARRGDAWRTLRVHAAPEWDQAHRYQGHVGTIEDITEEREAQALQAEQDARFRLLANTTPIGIFATDAAGRATFLSDAWCALVGRTQGESLGYDWTEVMHPEDRGWLLERWQAVTLAEGELDETFRYLLGDGRVLWIHTRAVPMRSASGEVEGYVGTVQDITLERELQARLRASEEQLRAVVEDQTELICRHDAAGTIEFINPAYGRLMGMDPAAMVGQTLWEHMPPELAGAVREQVDLLIRDGGVLTVDLPMPLPSGEIRHVQWTATSRVDANGAVTAVQAVGRDVTELRQAFATLEQYSLKLEAARDTEAAHATALAAMVTQLEESSERAEEATRAKSAFLATMSHELRTPLNAILGYSELLLEEFPAEDHPSLTTDLGRIHGAGRHLLQLINEILDLSKIEAGRMEIHPEELHLGQLMSTLRGTLAPLAKSRNNGFSIDLAGAPPSCLADQMRLRQILMNLLGNAFKFTEDGEVTLQVALRERGGESWLTFAITDTGMGISPENAALLFRDFVQIDQGQTRAFAGTGLGLSLSQRLARLMGGEITLQSELGVGSTFTLWLPQVALSSPVTGVEPRVLRTEIDLAHTLPHQAMQRRVLIIEDDPLAADLISKHLAAGGWHSQTALSGNAGIAQAELWQPHVITLDVLMPNADGWTILKALKHHPDLAAIPVVMISMTDDRQRGLALGAAEFLSKPITQLELVSTLNRITGLDPELPILVVEDDQLTRELLRRQIEEAGWQVLSASTGTEALHQLAIEPVRCLLLDLMLPEVDGFEVLRQLRASDSGRDVPVIVLTNKELEPAERRWLTEQGAAILQKADTPRTELLDRLSLMITPSPGAKILAGKVAA